MNLRLFWIVLFSMAVCGRASARPAPFALPPLERDEFDVLHSVAPELRKERLEMINDGFAWSPHGRLHTEFRYTNDPQAKCRVLILDRYEALPGSKPRVTLVSGIGQWYFVPFPQGGGQEKWNIRHRQPYRRVAR